MNTSVDPVTTVTAHVLPSQYYVSFDDEVVSFDILSDQSPFASVAAKTAFVHEGEPAKLVFIRTGTLGSPLIINYEVTSTVSATDSHVTLGSFSCTIPADDDMVKVTIPTLRYRSNRIAELVTVTITASPDYVRAANSKTSFDVLLQKPTVEISAPGGAIKEGDANPGRFVVTRSGNVSEALTVFYQISGDATNGTDYAKLSGQAVIRAGQKSAEIALDAVDDQIAENPEKVTLTLAQGSRYLIGTRRSASINIVDNEPTIAIKSVRFDNIPGMEGLGYTRTAILSRTGSTRTNLQVHFVADNQTLNIEFPANSNELSVNIPGTALTRTTRDLKLLPTAYYHVRAGMQASVRRR
jgi:hypothetical protein